uniref:Uncharacterized protein n=1 Tax=Oryza sativa subsp. japonica TaxID=39947 RepID=Q69VE1_ORYSJ|nr:hypothetical protein [Oryza sativa Japonica Group]
MGVVSDGVMIAPAAGDSPVAVAGEGRRGRKGEASSIGVGLSSKGEQRGTARRHANCPPTPRPPAPRRDPPGAYL